MRRYRGISSGFPAWAGVLILLFLVVFIGGCGLNIYANLNRDHVTLRIQDKAIKRSGGQDSSDKYMLYTDKGVYEDTDSLLNWKFNSSDLYGQLQVGHTYDCEIVGFRVPLISSYKNLLDCEEADG